MKKAIMLCVTAMLSCLLLTGCHFKHEWVEATCTEPRTCVVGGETEGEALGHTWLEATCTEPAICSVCEETNGEALGHTWSEATCTEPAICSVCEETNGEALGHTWSEATCTEPAICSVCGETNGEALGHTWLEANCLRPQTCSVCGITEGEISDHTWVDASCQAPKTCSVCGLTEGEALEHNLNPNSGYCTYCDKYIGIPLTFENVDQYLSFIWKDAPTLSYRKSEELLAERDPYPVISVEWLLSTGYRFYDVELHYTIIVKGGKTYASGITVPGGFKDGEYECIIHKDSYGGSDDGEVGGMEIYGEKANTKLPGITYTYDNASVRLDSVSGYVIEFGIRGSEERERELRDYYANR